VSRRAFPRKTVAVGTTLTALASAAVLVGGLGGADASGRVHAQDFEARATAHLATGPQTFVQAEDDVAGSTTIGHDVLACTSTRTQSTCDITIAQSGGLLYAHFVLHDATHAAQGRVTGGTDRYRNARGTLTAEALSQSVVRVSLRYTV
jgi:hypothetical protein